MRTARIEANRLYRTIRMPSVWSQLGPTERFMVWDKLQMVGSPIAARLGVTSNIGPCTLVVRGQQKGLG